ncbi:MAG TPA: hypothetical protein DDW50_21080 [Firmicutes bacterium]|jgi:hypothetical protein|nr:hypothetical protein [Bacillota bacterium]
MSIQFNGEIRSMQDKFLDRLEEVETKIKENPQYIGQRKKIDEKYELIYKLSPDAQPIVRELDNEIWSLVCRVQEFYYLQGLKDGLELKALMERGLE